MDTEKIVKALKESANVALEKARQTGTKIVIWHHGGVREFSYEEIMVLREGIEPSVLSLSLIRRVP